MYLPTYIYNNMYENGDCGPRDNYLFINYYTFKITKLNFNVDNNNDTNI